MNKSTILKKTEDFVMNQLKAVHNSHSWWHTERVWKNAKSIASTYTEADSFIVQMWALLHDIGDAKFSHNWEEKWPELVWKFLKTLDISKDIEQHIINIITHISFRNSKEKWKKFSSLELQIVQDADKLESLGAIWIARAFMYAGLKDRVLHIPWQKPKLNKTKSQYTAGTETTINHFYEKLLLLKDMLHTQQAKKMAQSRHNFMKRFLKQFYAEWDNEK